jgi:hypothetical protein
MRAVTRLAVLLFTRKRASSMKNKTSHRHVQKSLQEYGMVSLDQPSPTPATFSAMKTPENTEENCDDPEPADERDNPTAQLILLISCAVQV